MPCIFYRAGCWVDYFIRGKSRRIVYPTREERASIMTTVETMPALRTRLLADLDNKRSYLQLAGEGLGYNERMRLVLVIREQLGLTDQELDGMFSLSSANLITLESKDGLGYEMWLRVAEEISKHLKVYVPVITKEDIFAFAMMQAITVVGEMINTVTTILVDRATTPSHQR